MAAASTSVASGTPEMQLCANECFKSAYNSAAKRQCASGDVACYCGKTLFFQQVHDCGLATCTTDELEESLNYLGRVWCPGNANIDASNLVEQVLSGEVLLSPTQPAAGGITVSASRTTDPAELSTIFNGSIGPPREATVTSASNTSALATDAVETGSSRTTTSVSGAPQSAQVSSPTNESTQSSKETADPSPNSGLSTGAKAGIGAGIAVVALILLVVAFVFWRRRKRMQTTPPYAIGGSNGDVDGKAELVGTEAEVGYRFTLTPKPELDGNEKGPVVLAGGRQEMDGERRDVVPELDSRAQPWSHASELGNERRTVDSPAVQHTNTPDPSLAGPIPAASDLYPAPQPQFDEPSAAAATGTSKAERDGETDFEYEARRLQERRAMIAERKRLAEEEEQIAMEEEALRRKRAAAQSARY